MRHRAEVFLDPVIASPDREWHIGRLDKALDEAMAKHWTVVDMKKDFKRVFPFDK